MTPPDRPGRRCGACKGSGQVKPRNAPGRVQCQRCAGSGIASSGRPPVSATGEARTAKGPAMAPSVYAEAQRQAASCGVSLASHVERLVLAWGHGDD